MNIALIFGASVLILCIAFSKLLYKVGIPTLLIFLSLGMLFGSDGIGKVPFSDYELAEDIASLALVFIMFFGGFGTSWKVIKPVAFKSILLSSIGTTSTAFITGFFCYYVLNFSFWEGMLIGAVLASTDAASVFSILRSRKLSLKGGTAPILEVESGSNDPFSYMLTIVIISILTGSSEISVPILLLKQIFFGITIGVGLGLLSSWVLRNIHFEIDSFHLIFVVAIAILGYSISDIIGGNGFLSVYITGLIIGSSKIYRRKSLSSFFDGISWLMQIMLFFMLGLLSFPSQLPDVAITGTLIAIFMMLIARPISVFLILSFFKTPINQQLFISFVGIRGAASIAFSIYAVTSSAQLSDIFHIVFIVVLFSIIIQGSFIPLVAKKLNMLAVDPTHSLKSLSDMEDETYNELLEFTITENHKWANKKIVDIEIPKDILIVMIKRGKDIVAPKGQTILLPNDKLVLSGSNLDKVI